MSKSAEQTPDQQSATAAASPDKTAFPKAGGGYCNPPVHNRFKKGCCPNPKGRPRGSKSLKSILDRLLTETIEARDGKKVRKMTKYEALLHAQWQKGVQGDTRAAHFIQALANATGLFASAEDEAVQFLSKDDAVILKDYVRAQIETLEIEAACKPGPN